MCVFGVLALPHSLAHMHHMHAGRNQNGQLGLGHNNDALSPQLVEAFRVSFMIFVFMMPMD